MFFFLGFVFEIGICSLSLYRILKLINMLVKFDYAMKTLLRNKANFDVLEGFIEVFLGKKCTIINLLESEANQEDEEDKYNRVDIKAVDENGEIFIVEVQTTRYTYYMERVLFGVSKAVVEQLENGDDYGKIHKIYSISIVYYDFGVGEDFIYEGKTSFIGLHKNDTLKISRKEDLTLEEIERNDSRQYKFTKFDAGDIMPVYYIIRVRQFRESARNAMNEWMEFLKNNSIRPDTTVPGLEKAKEKLQYEKMTPEQRARYDRHRESLHNEYDAIRWATASGKVEGRDERSIEIAISMKKDGMPNNIIAKYTGLPEDLIEGL